MVRRRLACILVAAAATAIRAPRRSATALAVRGGATKTKKASKAKVMDPTGTPTVAKLLRPATALQAKYEAIAAEDPMRGLLIQVGGSMMTMKLISKILKKSGDKQAALVGRLLYVAYLALHQLILNYVEQRIEELDDESKLTIPGNPMLAQLAKQQGQGGGEVAQALVEKLGSKETTVKAYDLDMVLKGRRSQVGSLCVTAYLHLKKGMVQPLVAQVVMGLVALLRDPLVRVHVLGEAVDRPFAPPQPAWLKAMQGQMAEASEKAAAEGVEDGEAAEGDDEDSEEGDDDDADDDDGDADDGDEEEYEEDE
jgi:hypothetical protein